MMTQTLITQYITGALDHVDVATGGGDRFFFFGTDRKYPMPFATIVTHDTPFDDASKLDREGVFRLNVGVSRETFVALFGPVPGGSVPGGSVSDGPIQTGHDFAAVDVLMPHPMYGRMFWVCALNPGEATFEKIKPLLAEAHAIAAERSGKKS